MFEEDGPLQPTAFATGRLFSIEHASARGRADCWPAFVIHRSLQGFEATFARGFRRVASDALPRRPGNAVILTRKL